MGEVLLLTYGDMISDAIVGAQFWMSGQKLYAWITFGMMIGSNVFQGDRGARTTHYTHRNS